MGSGGSSAKSSVLAVPAAAAGRLQPHDFSEVFSEKLSAHLEGTREWAFSAVVDWLRTETAGRETDKLFWLIGGGGTGKSVLFAEQLRRLAASNQLAAWHFCRHDNPRASKPAALLQSVAAILAHQLPGFAAAFDDDAVERALASSDVDALFEALVAQPLGRTPAPPSAPVVIMIDALDEIPKAAQRPLLELLARQLLERLPPWMRLFVTSRDEPLITHAFARFNPTELRADEERNRQDVDAFLHDVAREFARGDMTMADLELDCERVFPSLRMDGKLTPLETPMLASKEAYSAAMTEIEQDPAFARVLAIRERRDPSLQQQRREFEEIYRQAALAQARITAALASAWEPISEGSRVRVSVAGTTAAWVPKAFDPGVKGRERALQKVENDYRGNAAMLKDLARVTIVVSECAQVVDALPALRDAGFAVLQVKNKFSSPTPMGYRDLNLVLATDLDEDPYPHLSEAERAQHERATGRALPRKTTYLFECQINHERLLAAKAEAHVH